MKEEDKEKENHEAQIEVSRKKSKSQIWAELVKTVQHSFEKRWHCDGSHNCESDLTIVSRMEQTAALTFRTTDREIVQKSDKLKAS